MAIAKHIKIAADDPSLLPSDDDDDDFTLDDDAAGAGSGSSGSDSDSDDDRPSKRNKLSHVEQAAEPSLTKQDVDDLWASFNAEPDPYATPSTSHTTATTSATTATASTPHNDSTKPSTSATTSSQPKTIKIQVEYKFVGETVMQEKEVPIDSPEAREWLAKQSQTTSTAPPSKPDGTSTSTPSKLDSLFGAESESTAESSSATTTSATTEPAATTKPATSSAPRRPKSGGLGALAASLSSKPAKLNTLEKSKLDWGQFVTKEEGLQDDLNHNRKGGYLEKQDFLDRTEQAREEAWEKSKSTRRK